jgi:hypothetical protein
MGSMSELREQVKARLVHLVNEEVRERKHALHVKGVMPLNPPTLEVVADEVIRLMEWSRQKCAGQGCEIDAPLTLAPEDFRP